METAYDSTPGSTELNWRTLPGVDGGLNGKVLCPRATYWVHPVCYAWAMNGQLGLRVAPQYITPMDPFSRDPGRQKPIMDPSVYTSVVTQANPTSLMPFPPNKFLIGVLKGKTGSALGGSCLRSLAWWWVASNFCGDWLLNAAQLFGIPFRKAKMGPGSTQQDWDEVREMLQNCGSRGYMLMKDINDVEFMESSAGGGQSPQAFLFHFADSQKRKVILRQTMTGGQHGAAVKGVTGAFGDVEKDTKSECIDAGAMYACSVINLQLIPSLLILNYGEDGDLEAPTCKLVDDEDGGLTDAQTLQIVGTMVDVPASYMRRVFKIPAPQASEPVAGVDEGTLGEQAKVDAQNQKDANDAKAAQATALAKAGGFGGQGVKPQPGQTGGQGGQGSGADDTEADGLDSRNALQAGGADSKYGCLMAMLPEDTSKLAVDWAKANVDPKTLVADGIETEPHVTVFYGFDAGFNTNQLADIVNGAGKINLKVGRLSRFECPDYDVLKWTVKSPKLEAMNEDIGDQFADSVTPSQHDYNPHITVAYVQKGSNKNLDGQAFGESVVPVQSLLYSEPNKTNRVSLPLLARNSGPPVEVAKAASVLHETVKPMLDRLDSIAKVESNVTRAKLLKKFLADQPKIAEAMKQDTSLAKAITPDLIQRFLKGIASK